MLSLRVFAGILSPYVLKVSLFAGILSTQISKALCFYWHRIASCVQSVVSSGHPIDTNIKSIAFFLASYRLMCQKCRYLWASYRHKYQKHNVFAGILVPHVLKVLLFAAILSTQILKASCFCWRPIASCVKSVFITTLDYTTLHLSLPLDHLSLGSSGIIWGQLRSSGVIWRHLAQNHCFSLIFMQLSKKWSKKC